MAQDHKQPLNDTTTEPAPRKKSCTGFCCCKLLVVIYGLFFLLIGLILLILGIVVEVKRHDPATVNDYLASPVILAIVIGILMIVFGLIGIIGAAKEHVILLRIFLAIIIIVFILQIVVGIIAFVYREKAIKVVGNQMDFAIKHYHDPDYEARGLRRAVDYIQRELSCCGLKRPSDWESNPEYKCNSGYLTSCGVPDSCCEVEKVNCGINIRKNLTLVEQARQLNTEGCTWKFGRWVEFHLDVIGAVALAFAIPQILGIFLVYTYITKVEDRRYLFQYSKYKQRLTA